MPKYPVLDSLKAAQVDVGDEIIGSNMRSHLVTAIARISTPGIPGSEIYEITTTDPKVPVRRLQAQDSVLVTAFSKVNA